MMSRPTRGDLKERRCAWSQWEAKLAPMQEAAWGVDAGVLNYHCGRKDVPSAGLTGRPDQDLSWIIAANAVSEQANERGEFGSFVPQNAVRFALADQPAHRRQNIAEVSKQCYQGLVLMIRRSHPGFWMNRGCHARDLGMYQQDPCQLSVDALMFLTGCLQWTKDVTEGRFPLSAFQSFVQPSAATSLDSCPTKKKKPQKLLPDQASCH